MILRSRFPDIEIPDQPLHSYTLAGAARLGRKPAIIDGQTGERLTYHQLARHVERLASALAARGVGHGDVVAILSPNSIWYPVVFHGIAASGAVSTPMNPRYTTGEIAHQLRDSGARLLVTVAALLDRALPAIEGLPIDEVIVLDGADGYASLPDLLATDAAPPRARIDPATDLVTLPYSSGTTGPSKGVMLTHRNLVANIAQSRRPSRVSEGDERIIAVLPFFHIYGLTVLMNLGLQTGSTVVVLPSFEVESFLLAIQDHRVTRAYVAPPIVLALTRHPEVDGYDLSSLRCVSSGAAPLDEELALACEGRIGHGVDVLQGYGMTELSPVSHTSPDPGRQPDGAPRAPKGSIGYAVPNTDCRLVDVDTGIDVDTGAGELWVRGPQVMAGYLGNPEATAATIDADGWLRTGDIVTVDHEGRFTVVDRLKELIKYKGYQVAPADLEAVLLRHADIADAAVVGVPDEATGEVPKAFVVRRPGSGLTADQVIEYVAAAVAPHKKVRQVTFVDHVPKSPSGKILRRQVRAIGS